MIHERHTEVVEAEGHLVDSNLLTLIFDVVVRRGGTFEVLKFDIGRTNEEVSRLSLKVTAPGENELAALIGDLLPLGCHVATARNALVRTNDKDHCAPDDFYSTTNHRTYVRSQGQWHEVQRQRMDSAVVIDGDRAVCRKLRDLRAGDLVVCGIDGIRVVPEFRERDRFGFAFMNNDVSSERRVETSVGRVAEMIRDARRAGLRVAVVAGPVVVHTGGGTYFCDLIRGGHVDVVLSGNALAVHDVECALFGTSLGVELATGVPVEGGHKHHMRAINTVVRSGGIRAAVMNGTLQSGIMYECVRHDVEVVLAGSIRDDGPLPETIMDLVEAQDRYATALEGTGLVLMLSTMLHGIGVGNMLPSWVRVVCVDINPAVVTKLMDRGSAQTIGLVTDVGLFLHQLAAALGKG